MMPESSVILVKTDSPFASSTVKLGQTCETIVVDTVRVGNFTIIPAGSRIRGMVFFAQVATRQASGVIRAK